MWEMLFYCVLFLYIIITECKIVIVRNEQSVTCIDKKETTLKWNFTDLIEDIVFAHGNILQTPVVSDGWLKDKNENFKFHVYKFMNSSNCGGLHFTKPKSMEIENACVLLSLFVESEDNINITIEANGKNKSEILKKDNKNRVLNICDVENTNEYILYPPESPRIFNFTIYYVALVTKNDLRILEYQHIENGTCLDLFEPSNNVTLNKVIESKWKHTNECFTSENIIQNYCGHNCTVCCKYNDTDTCFDYTKESSTIILFIICFGLLVSVIVILGLLLFFKKEILKRKGGTSKRKEYSILYQEPRVTQSKNINENRPVTENWDEICFRIETKNFTHYCKELVRDKFNILKDQYRSIKGIKQPSKVAQFTENINKNRYPAIIPDDENRIILKRLKGESDYVNARYVSGIQSSKQYILAQHPLANTILDFWQMIVQEKIRYIVMVKCLDQSGVNYWPEIGNSVTYNDVEVILELETVYEFYTERKLSYKTIGKEYQVNYVHQFEITYWNRKKQLPVQVWSFLLNKMVHVAYTGSPLLLHSSSGIGRCAVLALCDSAYKMASQRGYIDIQLILKKMQTVEGTPLINLEQYKLVHFVVLDTLTTPIRTIKHDINFEDKLLQQQSVADREFTYLEENIWIDQAIYPLVQCVDCLEKTRYKDILPNKTFQIKLNGYSEEYIHAMRVRGYNKMEFLSTQTPMEKTLIDFWSMVLEQSCNIIVILNTFDPCEETYCNIVPKEVKELNLRLITTKIDNEYYYERHSIAMIYSNSKKDVDIFLMKNWVSTEEIPEIPSILAMYRIIHKYESNTLPILLACDNGITACGLMVCLTYILDKYSVDKECDIYGATRLIKNCHKSFITQKQYRFLFSCVMQHFQIMDD